MNGERHKSTHLNKIYLEKGKITSLTLGRLATGSEVFVEYRKLGD
jgi:hypothetical protein